MGKKKGSSNLELLWTDKGGEILLQSLYKYDNFTPTTAQENYKTFTRDFECMKKIIKRNLVQVLSVRDKLCDNEISDFNDSSRKLN